MRTRTAMVAVALAAGTAQAAPAVAQVGDGLSRTTGDLARFCRMEDRTFCYGFMTGAWQFYEALVAYEGAEDVNVDPFVCPGREVSGDEAVAAFVRWVDANPDAVGEAAVDGLFRAWAATFPCD